MMYKTLNFMKKLYKKKFRKTIKKLIIFNIYTIIKFYNIQY